MTKISSIVNRVQPRLIEIIDKDDIMGKFVKVVCGAQHYAAIDSRGCLYTWGGNFSNCLGFKHEDDLDFPNKVDELKEFKILDVSLGKKFTCVIAVQKNNQNDSKRAFEFKINMLNHAKSLTQKK